MKTALALLLGLALAAAAASDPYNFTVSPGSGQVIRFESKAPLETVTGTTDQVSGTITLDPANLGSGVSAAVVVDPASIETGNSTRDGHMRDNHLHTDQYPEIRFTIDSFTADGALAAGQTRKFEVPGVFTLHGVTRQIQVPVEVTYQEEGGRRRMRVAGNFQVKLSEYNIPRPQFLIMRLDDVQNITVDFWGEAK